MDVTGGVEAQLRHEVLRLLPVAAAAVKHGDFPGTPEGGSGENCLCGTAGAHQRQLLPVQGDARLPDAPQPAHAVGIVTYKPSVFVDDGIHRPCKLGLRRKLVQIGNHGGLVGHGEVCAPDVQRAHSLHCAPQPGLVHVKGEIPAIEPQRLKGGVVHQGGLGVAAGVGKKGVQGGGGVNGAGRGHGNQSFPVCSVHYYTNTAGKMQKEYSVFLL